MLQYVEFEKKYTWNSQNYYFTPPEGVKRLERAQKAAWVLDGTQVATVCHGLDGTSWTEVRKNKEEFAIAVTVMPSIEGGWKRNVKFYEKYLHAVSSNRDCVYWIAFFSNLGINVDRLESLFNGPVVPYPLASPIEIKSLALFIGVEKMLTLVSKTTYKGVEGEEVEVDEALVGNCCLYYKNLVRLGHSTLDKPVRYRDWRKVYRVLTEWYQEVCPAPDINQEEEKVQFSISPQQKAVDGITVDEYTLQIPKTGGELIQWGKWLNNCLVNYVTRVCQGIIIVGIFREGSICYALEIEYGYLVQFKGLSNMTLPSKNLESKVLTLLTEVGLLNQIQEEEKEEEEKEVRRQLFENPDYIIGFNEADYYLEEDYPDPNDDDN